MSDVGLFAGGALAEVPLVDPPLATVLCQVKFETKLSVNDERNTERFQKALGDGYPRLNKDRGVEFVFSSGGLAAEPSAQSLWRFQSKERDWQITLASDFISIETKSYQSRSDFSDRLAGALEAFNDAYGEALCTRIGVRYINQLAGVLLADLATLTRPEIHGPVLAARQSEVELVHSLSDSRFVVGDDIVQVKWGLIPPLAVLDPAYAARDESTWTLDIDVYRESETTSDASVIASRFDEYSKTAYGMFRWAMTDEYLALFGGGQ